MRRFLVTAIAVAALGGLAVLGYLHHRSNRYDEDIARSASRYGVDFYLVKAVIFEESRFRADIRGAHEELGLMQVSLGVVKDYALAKGLLPFRPERVLQPALNIDIGTWYLKESMIRYRDAPVPILFALLRYNAGETRADRWLALAEKQELQEGQVGPASAASPASPALEEHYLSLVDYPGTRAYARNILKRYRSRNFLF